MRSLAGKPAVIALCVGIVVVGGLAASATTRIRVALDWTPNTNHTGIFVADTLGYFAAEDLEVEVLEPSPIVSLQLVASGRAEFGISSQEYITMARAEGTPVVSVAALYPHNTSGFAALRSASIFSPADFAGRRYGGWGSDLEAVMIETVMREVGADPATVEVIGMGTLDFATAVQAGLADFFWIYYGWEGLHAVLMGLEISYLPLSDLDPVFDYYTPVVASSESYLAEQPDAARRFLGALARGYAFAAATPDAAADILLARVPELDPELVAASQRWLAERSVADIHLWGRQDVAVWERFAAWALDHALVRRPVDAASAYTNAFLPGAPTP